MCRRSARSAAASDVAAGDVNGDGAADLVVGAQAGGWPVVTVISGATGATLSQFLVYNSQYSGGLVLDVGDINRDGRADIAVGPATSARRIRIINGRTIGPGLTPADLVTPFNPFSPQYQGARASPSATSTATGTPISRSATRGAWRGSASIAAQRSSRADRRLHSCGKTRGPTTGSEFAYRLSRTSTATAGVNSCSQNAAVIGLFACCRRSSPRPGGRPPRSSGFSRCPVQTPESTWVNTSASGQGRFFSRTVAARGSV